jgi:hypothetical protein
MELAGSNTPAMPTVVLSRKRPTVPAACGIFPCSTSLAKVTGSPRLLKKLETPVRTGSFVTAR